MKKKINWSGRSHNYSNQDIKTIVNCIKFSDPLTQGKYLKLFESKLRNYLGRKNVFATSSATSSLELIAQLSNLKKNDEVIVPAHTYCSSAYPFAKNGAKLIWGDINLKTRTLCPLDTKKKISKKTRAIIVVHLNGFAADLLPFKKLIKNKKILLIEDCSQAFGSELRNRKAGTLGDFGCYSFHAQKNLTTLGEGGAIYIKDSSLAKKLPGLRHNGHSGFGKRKFYWKPAMVNVKEDLKYKWPNKFTLSEVQCAAGSVMIKKIDKMNNERIKRAKYFIKKLNKLSENLIFNSNFENKRNVYHLLPALVNPNGTIDRDSLIKKLSFKFGIQCVTQYYPLYKYDLFKKKGFAKHKCPNTDYYFDNMISFPFHLWMSMHDLDYIIASIKKIFQEIDDKKSNRIKTKKTN